MSLTPGRLGSPSFQDAQLQARLSRSNEKKFVCNYLPDCKAAFSRQEHLQRHIRKHTGERPFSCGCGRTFTRLDNLRQHAQTVHSGTEMERVSEEQTAIAAATKMRPTPNSPPPRVDGGSDTDPYPRPAMKASKSRSRPTTREPSIEAMTPPTTTPQPTELSMPNVYDSMTFSPSVLDQPPPAEAYQPPSQAYTTYAEPMPTYTPPPSHHHHLDVESSVGSQPISSLAKRRAPKHDFVYTGGLLHNTGPVYDFTRVPADEGEQMSEYINNGLEPKSGHHPEQSHPDGLQAMNLLSELAAARRD